MTCINSSPKDIASVQVGGKTYVFFVNKDNRLCYVEKGISECIGEFVAHPVEMKGGLKIKPDSRQLAAVAWVPKDTAGNPKKDAWEIRVYCVCQDGDRGYLQEVCLSKGKDWYQGWMGSQRQKDEDCKRRYVDDDSSLSVVGSGYESLQVFVSGRGENGMPKIEVHSYKLANGGDWDIEAIQEPAFTV